MDKGFEEFLDRYLEIHRDEAIAFLQDLVRIKSVTGDEVRVRSEEDPDEIITYPFGKGVEEAFSYMEMAAEKDGFSFVNVDNYGGHIALKTLRPAVETAEDAGEEEAGEEDGAEALDGAETGEEAGAEALDEEGAGSAGAVRKVLGVLAHLDVVPEGDGWEHDPYSGDLEDGYIWGRGTTDDKGPLVASYYAMKALKAYSEEKGTGLKDEIRLILGLDEETNWEGMERYFEKEKKPDYGFSPDGYFPVLNGEKGIMRFKIAAKLQRTTMKGLVLRKLSGGTAPNMVPDSARAVVNDVDPKVYDRIWEMVDAYEISSGHKLKLHKMGKSLEIKAEGVAAHGSTPEKGLNAISVLVGFLSGLNFVNEGISNFFDFYNDAIAFDTEGRKIGCAMEDEESGKLTLNAGMIDYDGQAMSVTVDVRYPVTKTSDEVYGLIMPKIDEYGLGVLKEDDREPIYFREDDPMIETCLSCYREVTGDEESRPIVIGGGTYARTCDNMVAFGALFPGDPDIMHQRNEKLSVDRFFEMMKIYGMVLYKLAS